MQKMQCKKGSEVVNSIGVASNTMGSIMKDMKEQVDFLKENSNHEFSQRDFMKYGFFPWAKDSRTWGSFVRADMLGENLLKTRIEGEGHQIKYFIKGSNIIKFLNKYGSLLMSTVRTPRNAKNKKGDSSSKTKSK